MNLKVEKLCFGYDKLPVLSELSFSMEGGSLTALLGANGAGKSTLFKCILGLLKKYSGRIEIDAKDTKTLSARQLSRLIAYIPQSHYPVFQYSVMDMVLMGTAPQIGALGAPKAQQREQAEFALGLLGIKELAQRSFMRLSGGEQQLVLIARALAQQAQILLMDEPTANLDFGNQHLVLSTAQRLKKEGYAVLLSTHNPQQALLYSDRLIALKNGTIIADGAPMEALDSELIERLYGIKADVKEGSVIPRL